MWLLFIERIGVFFIVPYFERKAAINIVLEIYIESSSRGDAINSEKWHDREVYDSFN